MEYFILLPDTREASVTITMDSLPPDWLAGDAPLGDTVTIELDDPDGQGVEEGCGDLIGGAGTMFSARLKELLAEYENELFQARPAEATLFDSGEVLDNYFFITNIPRCECVSDDVDELLSFEIDEDKTEGRAIFRAVKNGSSILVINELVKDKLAAADLKSVVMVPTRDFDKKMKLSLLM